MDISKNEVITKNIINSNNKLEQDNGEKLNIRELLLKELKDYVVEIGYPKYAGEQIFEWLHKKYELDFDNMTNLSNDLREHLKRNFSINSISIKKKLKSTQDDTIKYLFELDNGECIEAVVMKYKLIDNTLCISTQAGCKMGCKFCASSVCKFTRNLSVSEMLDEVILVERDLGFKINNLVLMGIGEPLDNLKNVVRFLKLLPSKYGIHLGLRKVTISTCGLVDKIYELMEYRLQATLAISLHATNDETRNKIMPINQKWGINKLIKAADDYFAFTSRRISYEYVLINNFNDSEKDANELVSLLKNKICHVNLIPLNDIKERNYKRSEPMRVLTFQQILRKNGINTTVRRELGSDIRAACGQLRLQELDNS